MSTKTLTRSFAGGVITPEMFGRLDLTRYQTALAEAQNFLIYPHGPAANRAGTEYVLEVKASSKRTVLIPFIYSTTQSYALEFGEGYIRIHTQAGTVLEAAKNITGITLANPGVVTSAAHGFVNGQCLFLAAIGGTTQLNGRFVLVAGATANTFQLTDLAGNNIDTSTYTAYTAGGTASRVYEVTTPYVEADLADLHFTQSADVLTVVHPSYQQRELRRLAATNWTLTALSFTPTQAPPSAPVATPNPAGAITYAYVITAIANDGQEESLPCAEFSCNGNLTVAGNLVALSWADPAGATRFNVYKKANGLFGYIGQAGTGGSGFNDTNITPDMSKTPPISNDPFTSATNYPGEVAYFQGRRWFAATTTKPQNIWATVSGTESNMNYSVPTRDSDQLAFRIASRQANTIRHLVPLSEMLILTSGGEWHLAQPGSGVITPTTVDPRQDGTIGASNVRPVTTNSSIIYTQDRGARMREMQFSWQQQSYKTEDISIMAPHYFDGYTITQMAFARAPTPIVWAIRSDGTLLGLTYVPEHQVSAWHSHTTDGYFESCCVVPEGNEDALYVVVKRTIGGRTTRCVERMRSRLFTTLAASFFVDCGATYSGSAATVIGGLWHLESKTVSILADGAVIPQQVVSGGQVTLPQAASLVNIGLPIDARFKTLPLPIETAALGQGTQKNVNNVSVRLFDSSSIWAGPTYDTVREVKQRTTEPYGSPPSAITDEKRLVLAPNWNPSAQVCVVQPNPLPITVLSLTLDVALGG